MRTNGTLPLLQALALMTMVLTACDSQAQQRSADKLSDQQNMHADTPQTGIHVHKEYDEQGNLITFDSTYTSVRYTHGTDRAQMDSLLRDVRYRMDLKYPLLDDPGFNDLFFRDTLMYPDPFNDDIFRKRMEVHERWMQVLMAEMDSMKTAYLREFDERSPKPE